MITAIKCGDILESFSDECDAILQCVNCQNAMGAGLAGGNWDIIKTIFESLIDKNLFINYYSLFNL